MKSNKSKLLSALVAVGALLYTASPVDLVPELLAGPLGFGDDAVVLVGAVLAIVRIMRSRSARRSSTAAATPDAG